MMNIVQANETLREHLRRQPPQTFADALGVLDWLLAADVNDPSFEQVIVVFFWTPEEPEKPVSIELRRLWSDADSDDESLIVDLLGTAGRNRPPGIVRFAGSPHCREAAGDDWPPAAVLREQVREHLDLAGLTEEPVTGLEVNWD